MEIKRMENMTLEEIREGILTIAKKHNLEVAKAYVDVGESNEIEVALKNGTEEEERINYEVAISNYFNGLTDIDGNKICTIDDIYEAGYECQSVGGTFSELEIIESFQKNVQYGGTLKWII